MIWRLRSDEPSFSSINEKSFESRLVRTHPCTRIESTGPALCNAFLIGVGESCVIFKQTDSTLRAQRSTLNAQRSTRSFRSAKTGLLQGVEKPICAAEVNNPVHDQWR